MLSYIEYREILLAMSLDDLAALWNNQTVPSWVEGEDEPHWFVNELAFVLREKHPDAHSLLKNALHQMDTEWYLSALWFLPVDTPRDEQVIQSLKDATNNRQSSRARTNGLIGLARMRVFVLNDQEIQARLHDPDDRVAGWAMIYWSRANPSQTHAILLDALHSVNPRAREFACDEIDDYQIYDSDLIDAVRLLMTDPDENAREAANYAYETYLSEMKRRSTKRSNAGKTLQSGQTLE